MSAPFEPGLLWAALPVPALVTALRDGGETILDCNPAAELFLSASRAMLQGTALADRLAVDAPLPEAMARARANGAPIFINDVPTRAGQRPAVLCDLQLAPLGEAPGALLLLVAPREIAGRLGQVQAVQGAARSAIGLAAMLAHEIKNPLAGIAGAAQLLSMGLRGEDRELTDLIVAETRRIVALLDQVDRFGDQRPPERRAVNIHDVLEQARRSARLGFAAHMRLQDDYDPSLPAVWADPDQMLQVVLNLVKNAAEASPEGGTIRLRTLYEAGLQWRDSGGRRVALPVHVEVIDDGPGLPPQIAERAFEPFVSGRPNGTGLGLALVAKIIAAHDGWVQLHSRPGRTVFRLSLPLAPLQSEESP